MDIRILTAGRFCRFLCVALAIVMATSPSLSVWAQGYGAIQAVRQRVSGLSPGEGPPIEQPPSTVGEQAPTAIPASSDLSAGKIDLTYVSPNAAVVIVLRPAQILSAPIAQVFPVEVAAAAGVKYLGFDPAEIDEVVAFVEPISPAAPPAYGVTIKFKNPIRAASIPVERRAHAQLAELGGKKYLKSSVPMLYSLYGPNNKTLVLAPDALLQQLVGTANQPKNGPIVDRIRDVPSGSDLYIAADVASFRPLIQMGLAQAQAKAPPDVKPFFEATNLVAAAELTLNVATPGPMSLVIHGNDETAAQQLETLFQEARNKYQAQQTQQLASDDPIQQAMTRYQERMSKPFQPVRNGVSLTCFQIDGQDPAQHQLVSVALVGILVALVLPAVQAAREAARRAQGENNAPDFGGPPGAPAPEGLPNGPERPLGPGVQPIGPDGQPIESAGPERR